MCAKKERNIKVSFVGAGADVSIKRLTPISHQMETDKIPRRLMKHNFGAQMFIDLHLTRSLDIRHHILHIIPTDLWQCF